MRLPPRPPPLYSSAASCLYKRQQSRHLVLDVLAGPSLHYQIPCHLGEPHHLVQFSYGQKTSIGGYIRPPEFEHQMTVESSLIPPFFGAPIGFSPSEVLHGQFLAF